MKKVMKDVFLKLILHELLFLPKNMKIEKFEKHEANLHDIFT